MGETILWRVSGAADAALARAVAYRRELKRSLGILLEKILTSVELFKLST